MHSIQVEKLVESLTEKLSGRNCEHKLCGKVVHDDSLVEIQESFDNMKPLDFTCYFKSSSSKSEVAQITIDDEHTYVEGPIYIMPLHVFVCAQCVVDPTRWGNWGEEYKEKFVRIYGDKFKVDFYNAPMISTVREQPYYHTNLDLHFYSLDYAPTSSYCSQYIDRSLPKKMSVFSFCVVFTVPGEEFDNFTTVDSIGISEYPPPFPAATGSSAPQTQEDLFEFMSDENNDYDLIDFSQEMPTLYELCLRNVWAKEPVFTFIPEGKREREDDDEDDDLITGCISEEVFTKRIKC
jgi:hypothetical protein